MGKSLAQSKILKRVPSDAHADAAKGHLDPKGIRKICVKPQPRRKRTLIRTNTDTSQGILKKSRSIQGGKRAPSALDGTY
jgi:hypothetical protein